MKKAMPMVMVLGALILIAASPVFPESHDDIQAIKKAVKENPAYEPGKEVKWFKVLVTDTRTNKEKVKVTLPIALVETFAKCAGNKHFPIHEKNADVDFEQLLVELTKAGPMALIEIYEEDETVKVWLE